MPTKITVTGANAGVLDYVYSADGTKLQKKKTQSGSTITTDYIGDYVYENNVLKQITQPEGYIEPDGSGWQYVYRLTDIWGNTRITFADDNNDGAVTSSEIRREQNYYPLGMEHKGYNNVLNGVKNNLKTYQKQEFTEDLGLNTHEWRYRISDPAIGRFWQIDPLAEDYYYNSTYAFQENKLGMGIELEGLEMISWDDVKSFIFNDTGKGKPTLTLGLHHIKLPTAERTEGDFVGNVAKSIYNGVAGTWNAGMEGENLGDITNQGLEQLGETADRIIEGEATVEDFENIAAMAIVRKGKGKLNGNSKSSTKSQHGYEIVNETKGTRHKVGVSGGKLNQNGSSRRANSQVNKLNKKGGDTYSATVKTTVPSGKGARGTILKWEKNQVNQHHKKTGTTAPGQKRPKPDDN